MLSLDYPALRPAFRLTLNPEVLPGGRSNPSYNFFQGHNTWDENSPLYKSSHLSLTLGRQKGVFERWTSTGSGVFLFLGSGLAQICEQIVSIPVRALNSINVVGPVGVNRENASLLVAIRCSKMPGSETPSGKKSRFSWQVVQFYSYSQGSRCKILLAQVKAYFKIIIVMLPGKMKIARNKSHNVAPLYTYFLALMVLLK